jgi:hypothetical protein
VDPEVGLDAMMERKVPPPEIEPLFKLNEEVHPEIKTFVGETI